MYITTGMSIALMLFLVGLVCALLLASHKLTRQVRENVTMTVLLDDTISQDERLMLEENFGSGGYARSYRFISKDDALHEYEESLGVNPTDLLDENPLLASYELKMVADYAQSDSLAAVENRLRQMPHVSNVVYQRVLVDSIDQNLRSVTTVLLIVVAVLLLISIILINNTVRLGVYSKRFLIHTMRLVGASGWTIRRPFVMKNLVVGFVAALVALAMLFGVAYYLQFNVGVDGLLGDVRTIVVVAAAVVLTGVVLTTLAASISAGRYVRMKTNDLYYI